VAFKPSAEAAERSRMSVQAAEVFGDNALVIAGACAEAGRGEVIVAHVRPDLAFGGVALIKLGQLREHILGLDRGSWPLVFSPGVDLQSIEGRCGQMRRLAEARYTLTMSLLHRRS
jgi:hypothetical protein